MRMNNLELSTVRSMARAFALLVAFWAPQQAMAGTLVATGSLSWGPQSILGDPSYWTFVTGLEPYGGGTIRATIDLDSATPALRALHMTGKATQAWPSGLLRKIVA